MEIKLTAARVFVALVSPLFLLCAACQGAHSPAGAAPSPIDPDTVPSIANPSAATAQQSSALATTTASVNGAASQRPVYYDGKLFTVNMMEVNASDPLIAKNKSINEIYASNDLDEEQEFLSVIDAIPTDGMNPLWRQIFIVFNPGFTPHQFTSDDQIEAAAAGPNPEITLVETDEVYRCSVVATR